MITQLRNKNIYNANGNKQLSSSIECERTPATSNQVAEISIPRIQRVSSSPGFLRLEPFFTVG